MGSSYKTSILFICLISFDSGLQVDAGLRQSQSHLASVLAGGLIALMLQEAIKEKGGGFNSFRNTLQLSNHPILPEILNTPLTSYGSFSNFETYRNIPEIPIFGHNFGMKPFFQYPAALKYETSALIGNFIETQRFPSIGHNFADPYKIGMPSPSPLALKYNLDYFFTLRGLCKNIEKLNVQGLHSNALDNSVGNKNSAKKFEGIPQSVFEKKQPKLPQDMYTQGFKENELQNGPEYFPQEFQQNIEEEQLKNQMHDFPNDFRQVQQENLPKQLIQHFQNNIRQGNRENLPEHFTQHFSNNAGEGHHENFPAHLLINLPNNVEQDHPENLPEHLLQNFPNNAERGHRENLPGHVHQKFPKNVQDFRENPPMHNTQNLPHILNGNIYQNPTKHFLIDAPRAFRQRNPSNVPQHLNQDYFPNLPVNLVEDFPRHIKQIDQKNSQQSTPRSNTEQDKETFTLEFPNNFEEDLQQQLAKDFNENFANDFLQYVSQDKPQNMAKEKPQNESENIGAKPKISTPESNHSSHLFIQRNEYNQTSDSKTDGSNISSPSADKDEKNNKSESSFIDEIFIVNI